MKIATTTAAALLAGSLTQAVQADEREATLVNRNTTLNLIEALVKKGVLDRDSADAMIKDAKAQAVKEAREEIAREDAAAAKSDSSAASTGNKKGQSVHVAYVPQIVKKEIRDEVRAELRDEVVREVKTQAKNEKWGIPAALPDWVSRIKPYFDMRLRFADEFYQQDNAQYFDWMQINEDGGISQALADNQAFLNTRIDRTRFRERFRLGFDAQITEQIKAGFRFATSNQFSPVSNNQTLGNTGQSWEFAIDRAFLEYDYVDGDGHDWFTLSGGRIANPWVSSDVVYDPDLSFEGFAGTLRWPFNQSDSDVKTYVAPNPTGRFGVNMGQQKPDSVFATAGVFPIQEVDFSSSDKWLFGGQIGADWLVFDQSRLIVQGSYYHYKNISARRNAFESRQYDWTAPEFMQKGNSLVAINDAKNQPACNTGSLGAQNVCLVGLASGFQIFNASVMFDYADFAPTHVFLTFDYAKNLGFDEEKIFRQFGDRIEPKTNAYQVRLDIGRPDLRHFGDWGAYFAYRYLERDSVLDAFTDSVFHEGGTDAQGWVIGATYAVATNTWFNLRWFSTDAIDGPPLSVDTLTVDLNARF